MATDGHARKTADQGAGGSRGHALTHPTHIARAVALGASDYVLRFHREDLIATIEAAAASLPSPAGNCAWPAMKIRQVIDDDDVPLTRREPSPPPCAWPEQ